jgi:hypothetical protein
MYGNECCRRVSLATAALGTPNSASDARVLLLVSERWLTCQQQVRHAAPAALPPAAQLLAWLLINLVMLQRGQMQPLQHETHGTPFALLLALLLQCLLCCTQQRLTCCWGWYGW